MSPDSLIAWVGTTYDIVRHCILEARDAAAAAAGSRTIRKLPPRYHFIEPHPIRTQRVRRYQQQQPAPSPNAPIQRTLAAFSPRVATANRKQST